MVGVISDWNDLDLAYLLLFGSHPDLADRPACDE